MNKIAESRAGLQLMEKHPAPWGYRSGSPGDPAYISDANGNKVLVEGQVDDSIFDAVWAMYVYYFMR